jgi:hypothetical protein
MRNKLLQISLVFVKYSCTIVINKGYSLFIFLSLGEKPTIWFFAFFKELRNLIILYCIFCLKLTQFRINVPFKIIFNFLFSIRIYTP